MDRAALLARAGALEVLAAWEVEARAVAWEVVDWVVEGKVVVALAAVALEAVV